MNFSVLTFGCKVNQGESETIILNMINSGYEFFENTKETCSDIVIINSCTVTSESDRKLRQCIHRVRRENKSAIIILTGCMPQAFSEVAETFKEVDIIVGNSEKYNIPSYIEEYNKNKTRIFKVTPINKISKFEKEFGFSMFNNKYRAFLKIEDGCERYCSYCIIPYARGKVRSKPLEDIKNDVLKLCKNNYKEIVLTGINLSSYGKDLNISLTDAIKEVCSIAEVKRVRLGSLEPDLVTNSFIDELSKQEKICPQFHLSLQSGSNNVLKSMRRLYTREDYLKVVEMIRQKIPFATFTTDIMAGFSGELEEDLNQTLSIIEEVGFLKVHVFPYSVREGTLAAKYENRVEKAEKIKRVQKIIDISKKTSKIILEGFLNYEVDVLYETLDSDGYYRGYSKNYILVKSKSCRNICGKIFKTLIISVQNEFCIGKIIKEEI